jgi:hypothetical protein
MCPTLRSSGAPNGRWVPVTLLAPAPAQLGRWASRRDKVMRLFVAILLTSFAAVALAKDPDCSGIDR